MRFNPYAVDDDTLLRCVGRAYILPPPTFTQMAVFHFHEISNVRFSNRDYDAITYSIGDSAVRHLMPFAALSRTLSHHATYKPVHVQVNGYNLSNLRMIEKLQGRHLFVSHIIPENINNFSRNPCYRFHRLRGTHHAQADIIRKSMCEGKIKILEDIINYPGSPYYLGQIPRFDCYTPLWHAINAVRHFKESKTQLPSLDELIKIPLFPK